MFKSDKIDSSKKFYQEEFRPLIDNLSESDLLRIRTQTSNPLLVKMYEYFDTHTTNEQLISEIKKIFLMKNVSLLIAKKTKEHISYLLTHWKTAII